MELKDYWRTIRRRWTTIVLCVVAAVAVAAAVTFQTTPQYASTTQLYVSTTQANTSDAYTGNLFATQQMTSYSKLVSGRRLAERVADRLGRSQDPDDLRTNVQATVEPESVILEITATDSDPLVARDVAQAYGEELSVLVRELQTPDGGTDALAKASITDNARVSETPVSPNPVRNLGLALVLGLLLGIGLAVLRELLDTSLSSAEDVGAVTDAPILGHLISDPASIKSIPSQALVSATPWAEAFRVLRTNMQYVEVDHDHKVFVVSSSLPGEGKTTTATNLAITLALAHERVVLIECDLRRPQIGQRLGLDAAVGTTSVLIGKVQLADALQTYGDTGLRVLTSGPIPPNPSELLQSNAMEKLLVDLRGEFDIVILDAPPLLPVTDSALLAAQADGALVVVRHGKTTRDQLAHAIERIQAVDAKTVGVVINMAPAKRKGQSYGYGYGYGYAPDKNPGVSGA